MRRLAEFIGLAGGVALATLVFVHGVLSVPVDAKPSFWAIGAGLMGVLALGMFACSMLQAAVCTLFVLFLRGPKALGWVRPAQCRSMGLWLSSQWRFPGHGGVHEGFRLLGFEVALQGTLG